MRTMHMSPTDPIHARAEILRRESELVADHFRRFDTHTKGAEFCREIALTLSARSSRRKGLRWTPTFVG